MKRDEVTGGKFFNANDVREKDLVLTVTDATMEEFKAEDGYKQKKLVLSFRGTEKKLVCGKTKADLLFDLLGDDTDDWIDQRVRLFLGKTNFQGKRTDCVEVGMPKPPKAKGGKTPPPVPVPDEGDDAEDDGGEDEAPF